MKPAFDKAGTVTAGNASGINDGAGFLVLADAAKAAAGGHKAMARLVAYGIGGVPNDVMGEGPTSSCFAMALRCTSSGPSAKRRVRELA
jgi:acetyl-CoA C-acetyltransferase